VTVHRGHVADWSIWGSLILPAQRGQILELALIVFRQWGHSLVWRPCLMSASPALRFRPIPKCHITLKGLATIVPRVSGVAAPTGGPRNCSPTLGPSSSEKALRIYEKTGVDKVELTKRR